MLVLRSDSLQKVRRCPLYNGRLISYGLLPNDLIAVDVYEKRFGVERTSFGKKYTSSNSRRSGPFPKIFHPILMNISWEAVMEIVIITWETLKKQRLADLNSMGLCVGSCQGRRNHLVLFLIRDNDFQPTLRLD